MRSIRSTLFITTALLATSSVGARSEAAPAPKVAAAAAPAPAPKVVVVGTAQASQTVEFDVILPLRNTAALDTLLAQQQDPTSPYYHRWLTPAQFAISFGPTASMMNIAAAILRNFNMQVTVQSRSVHVVATVAQVNAAFNASLALAAAPFGPKRVVASGPLALPASLSALNVIITAFNASGFDASTSVRQRAAGYVRLSAAGYDAPANQSSPAGGYFYNDLKQAYGYPSYATTVAVGKAQQRLDGHGVTVAVLMGSDVLDSDVSTLFDHQNFTANSGQAADPHVFARRTVNGGAPFSVDNPSSEEATVDVQQVLGGAPGSQVVLYNTPDLSDQSLISGYTAIVNDNTADVVSLSFGQCEQYYTAAYNNGVDQTAILNTYTELFKQGNAQGITFIAASGDAGGQACISPSYFLGQPGQFITGVAEPAADPNVTAVGGTNLVTAQAAGGSGSAYQQENAWSDPEVAFDPFGLGSNVSGGVWGAGGGISSLYAKPSYQSLVNTGSSSSRTVPDVSMQMGGCPDIAQAPCNGGNTSGDGSGDTNRSYVNVVFNNTWDSVIGTSAAAPEMASAVALLVETQGRQGNLNPYLYTLAHNQAAGGVAAFHQSIPGFNGVVANNGAYTFTTGNGTPNVSAMIGLPQAPLAGVPGSATNP